MTSVRSSRSAARAAARSASVSCVPPVVQLLLELGPHLVQAPPGLPALLGVEPAQGAVGPGQGRTLAQVLGLDLRQRVGRRRGRDGLLRPHGPGRRCRDPRCQSPCRRPPLPSAVEEMLRAPAPPARRWRAASKPTTALATPTLSDSARPSIGMASAPSRVFAERGVETGRLVAEEHGAGHGPVERRRSPHPGARPWPACGTRRPTAPRPRDCGSSRDGEGDVEERSRRGAHRLGVVRIDRIGGEEDRRRSRGVGGPQDGAGIARVAHVDEDHDQRPRPSGQLVGAGLVQHGHDGQDRLRRHGVGHTLEHTGGQAGRRELRRRWPAGTPPGSVRRSPLRGRRRPIRRAPPRRGHSGSARRPRPRRRARTSAPIASAAGRATGGPAGA